MKQYFVSGVVLLLAVFGGVNFYLQPDVLRVGVVVGWLVILAGLGVIVTHRAVTPLLIPGLIIIGAMLLSSLANFDIVDFSLSRVWLFVVALSVMIVSHAFLSQADLVEGIYLAGIIWPGLAIALALAGWVDNANILAFWPLLFMAVALYKPSRGGNLIYWLTQLWMIFAFNSRGAWLGLAAMLGLVVWPYLRGAWPAYVSIFVMILAVLFFLNPKTAGYRFGYWFDAWQGFTQSPLFGLGPGGLKAGALISQPGDGGGYQIHAHNFLVSWVSQTGLIGLACLLLAIQKIRSMVWTVAPWQKGLLLGLLVWSMVDEPLFWPGPLLAFGLIMGTVKGETVTNPNLTPLESDDTVFEKYADLEFFEYEIDEWEQSLDDCGYHPESGFCLLAGTEYCDWDCKLSPIWEAEAEGNGP